MSPKLNVTSDLHEHEHKLHRVSKIISLVPDMRKFVHFFHFLQMLFSTNLPS